MFLTRNHDIGMEEKLKLKFMNKTQKHYPYINYHAFELRTDIFIQLKYGKKKNNNHLTRYNMIKCLRESNKSDR